MMYSKEFLEPLVAKATSYKELIKLIGLSTNGANRHTLYKYIKIHDLSITHFQSKNKEFNNKKPIESYLVEDSDSSRTNIKRRLYKDGLKQPTCEICGQTELWNGKPLPMILDHINGVNNDNRIENLRIVCPNCNYQLPTTNQRKRHPHQIKRHCKCGNSIYVSKKVYCSRECFIKYCKTKPQLRKVERPEYSKLIAELSESNFSQIGKKYGVSDNTIRKWIAWYEKEQSG